MKITYKKVKEILHVNINIVLILIDVDKATKSRFGDYAKKVCRLASLLVFHKKKEDIINFLFISIPCQSHFLAVSQK
jgi:hypothetical protein